MSKKSLSNISEWTLRLPRTKGMSKQIQVVLTLLVFASAPTALFANTAAYWRHEEGPAGSNVASGPDTVLDSSGNGNHMETFDTNTTAATYSSTVSPLALQSGLPNTLSLNFGPGGDGPDRNDDNFTSTKPIQTQLFTAMTVELAFNMNSVDGFQALFGKDGKPLGDDEGEIDSPIPPFKMMVRGDNFPNEIDNQIFVEWIDGNGEPHSLASGAAITTGNWNHVAFTLTATSAKLWVAGETGDYVLRDAISGADFSGNSGEVMIFEPLGHTVGRGAFDNNVTDWSDALIDEVRVSDTALLPNEFLFVTAQGLAGDYNSNGIVDAADYTVWRDNVGANAGTLPNDIDGGTIGTAQYDTWVSNFGSLASSASAVPEPTSLALLAGLIAASTTLHRLRD